MSEAEQPWKLYGAMLAELVERMGEGDALTLERRNGAWAAHLYQPQYAPSQSPQTVTRGMHEQLDCAMQNVAIELYKREKA